MFDAPYPYHDLGRETCTNDVVVERHTYKFKSKYRHYLVLLEVLNTGVVAIKYCDRKDKGAKNAFTKVFNEQDSDAIRIITTCLHIMAAYWKNHPNISFVFLASFRNIPEQIAKRRNFTVNKSAAENYRRIRFGIYKYAMFNLFDPEKFSHQYDSVNCIYLLLNNKEPHPELLLHNLTRLLSAHCELLFDDILPD